MPRRPHDGLGLCVRLAVVLAPDGAGQAGGRDAHQPVGASAAALGGDELDVGEDCRVWHGAIVAHITINRMGRKYANF